MAAKRILSLPRAAITVLFLGVALGFWSAREVTGTELHGALAALEALILQIFVLAWAFALYVEAKNSHVTTRVLGSISFGIAFVLLVATFFTRSGLASILGFESVQIYHPPILTLSALFLVGSIGFAVNALFEAEKRYVWPLRLEFLLNVVAVFFLPIGVWFLWPRIERLFLKGDIDKPRLV